MFGLSFGPSTQQVRQTASLSMDDRPGRRLDRSGEESTDVLLFDEFLAGASAVFFLFCVCVCVCVYVFARARAEPSPE